MDWLKTLVQATPEITLFLCLALGYLVGKLRVGPIQLGGICGTLIVALVVGLLDVTLNDQVKNIAFALFIFALGFTGGPQFFANLNRSGLRLGVLSFIEAVAVVLMVLALASVMDLDVGTASGIMAGSATESAVVGTASEAIAKLGLGAETVNTLQGHVATAYTVCYLFGLVTIVLFTSGLGPMLLRVNLRESAHELWKKMGGGDDNPGQAPAMPELVGRSYQVGPAAGQTVSQLEAALPGRAAVEMVSRHGKPVPVEGNLRLEPGDVALLRRDLAAEAAALAKELDIGSDDPDAGQGYYRVVLRAFTVTDPDRGPSPRQTSGAAVATRQRVVGLTVADFERQQTEQGRRIYITQVRRDGTILPQSQETVLAAGDVIAISANRGDLVALDPERYIGPETDDVELLGYQTESLHVVVSNKSELGKSISELRREPYMAGVFVNKLYRSGAEFPLRPSTKLERGDTLILTGPTRLVEPAAHAIGKPVKTSYATDMIWVGLGIFLGGCIGIPALHAGGVPISLSTSGGALIMGLVFGWLRAKYPTYGNIPPGAQWFMDTLGLCLFIAVVGINAGPSFSSGLSQAGWGLLVFGAIATVIPPLIGFAFGYWLLKIKFPILLGVLAGGQTTTAAIGAINESARSQVSTLGYTIPYAVSNVLLTIWGAVIVLLNH